MVTQLEESERRTGERENGWEANITPEQKRGCKAVRKMSLVYFRAGRLERQAPAPKHKSAQTVGATSGREATTFGNRFYWLFLFFSTRPLNRSLTFRLQYSSLCRIELSRTSQLLPSSFRRRPTGNRPLVGLSPQASGRRKVPRGSSSNDCPASASKSPHFLETQGRGLPAERGHPALGSLRLARPPPGSYLGPRLCVERRPSGPQLPCRAATRPEPAPPRAAAALTACPLSTCSGQRGPEVSGGCCQTGALMKGPASGSSLGRSEVSEGGISLWWVMTSRLPIYFLALPHFRTFFFF